MKLLETDQLAIPEIKVIRFARFCDHRGYFTEHFRKSDFHADPRVPFMQGIEFVQMNESYSRKRTIRGLHFQWNPYMGKLVRTQIGHMVDLVLDIRKDSDTFGKIVAFDMPTSIADDTATWIWVPPGFAHGNVFLEDTSIEYLCSGEYSPGCEAGISPLAEDIDWSLCDPDLRETFLAIAGDEPLITDKDRYGMSVATWEQDARSEYFTASHLNTSEAASLGARTPAD